MCYFYIEGVCDDLNYGKAAQRGRHPASCPDRSCYRHHCLDGNDRTSLVRNASISDDDRVAGKRSGARIQGKGLGL